MTPDTRRFDALVAQLAAAGHLDPGAGAVQQIDFVPPGAAAVVWRAGADKTAAQALVAGWDWTPRSAAAQAREWAVGALAAVADESAQRDRAIALVTADELNILRAQIVGVAVATWNPTSMANGTGLTSPNIAVAGAAFGDCVDVCAPYSLAGALACGYVSAAGQVQVRLHNSTGAAVDLASGTWKVVVRRHAAMPERTPAQIKSAVTSKITAGSAD